MIYEIDNGLLVRGKLKALRISSRVKTRYAMIETNMALPEGIKQARQSTDKP